MNATTATTNQPQIGTTTFVEQVGDQSKKIREDVLWKKRKAVI